MSARALTATALAALALAACGSDEDPNPLVWKDDPRILTPPSLPTDRILRGTVANDADEPIELEAAELRLVDSAGNELPADAIFLEGYVKPLESRNRPSLETEAERRRRGLEALIAPGATAPLTVSWRQSSGSAPARIEYDGGSLPLR